MRSRILFPMDVTSISRVFQEQHRTARFVESETRRDTFKMPGFSFFFFRRFIRFLESAKAKGIIVICDKHTV